MSAGNVRDFTHEAYEGFRGTIIRNRDEMHKGFLLSNYGITQETLDLARPYADVSVCEAIVERYQNKAAQMYQDSTIELFGVFEDVYQVEHDATADIQASKEDYISLVHELEALCDLIRPVDGQIKLFSFSLSDLKAYLLANSYNNEKAYDLLLQQRVFALLDDPEFSEEVWANLDEAGRQAFLNRLLERIQEIMGTSINAQIFFSPKNHKDGWRGSFDPATNTITIYPDCLRTANREQIMRTLFHEARHGYQWEVVEDWRIRQSLQGLADKYRREMENGDQIYYTRGDDVLTPAEMLFETEQKIADTKRHLYTGDDTAVQWSYGFLHPVPSRLDDPNATYAQQMAQYKLYLESRLEWDSFSFAGQFTSDRFENNEMIYSLHPAVPGSWHELQKP